MFKYNEISDLKSGELVTPIEMKEDKTVLCLMEDGSYRSFSFDDFDFSKTIEQREQELLQKKQELEKRKINIGDLTYKFKYDDILFYVKTEEQEEEKKSRWTFTKDKIIFTEKIII